MDPLGQFVVLLKCCRLKLNAVAKGLSFLEFARKIRRSLTLVWFLVQSVVKKYSFGRLLLRRGDKSDAQLGLRVRKGSRDLFPCPNKRHLRNTWGREEFGFFFCTIQCHLSNRCATLRFCTPHIR